MSGPGRAAARLHPTAEERAPDWRTAMAISHALGAELRDDRAQRATGRGAGTAVALREAAGMVLAQDLHASFDVPHYASSAMDGFAYADDPSDTAARHADSSWTLSEWTGPDHTLPPGHACPVVTGRLVPPGTTGIIRSEYAHIDDGVTTHADALRAGAQTPTGVSGARVLRLARGAPVSELDPGRHIRPSGREALSGDLIATAGTPLTPPLLALAAVCGHDELRILPPPAAALLFTGDEVVTEGRPAPGQVRDAFSVQLPHLLTLSGARVVSETRIGDDARATRDAFAHMLAGGTDTGDAAAPDGDCADLIVTTGGTGRSAADHVRSTLTLLAQETGGRIAFPEVAMRPGHPTLLALVHTAGGRPVPVLALPGNPLAAMAAMRVAGGALVRGLRGLPAEVPLTVPAGTDLPAQKVERLTPGRPVTVPHALAASVASAAGEPGWEPCGRTGSGMMRGLSQAQGWLVLPTRPVRAGERLPFLPLEW